MEKSHWYWKRVAAVVVCGEKCAVFVIKMSMLCGRFETIAPTRNKVFYTPPPPPTLMAFTDVHGPSPQPTAFRSPSSSLMTTTWSKYAQCLVVIKFLTQNFNRSRRCNDHWEPTSILSSPLLPMLRVSRAAWQRHCWNRRQGPQQQTPLSKLLLKRWR